MFLACICAVLIYLISFYFGAKQRVTPDNINGVHGKWKFSIHRYYFIFFIIILVLTSTVRYGFIDTYAYKEMYELSRNNLEYVKSAPWGVETGWLYLCYFLNYISSSPKLILFLSALIINYSYVKLSKNYSSDPLFSLLIYFNIIFLDTNNGIRQMVAAAITTLAFPLLTKDSIKNYILYGLCVLLAMQFHESAVVCFIVALVVKGKALNIKVILALLLGIIFLLQPGLVNQYIGDLFQDSKYLFYLDFEGYGMSLMRALVVGILPLILAIIYYIRKVWIYKKGISKNEAMLLNVLIVNSMFVLMGLNMQYWSRFSFYTSFASIVLLPKLILEPFYKSNFKLIKFLALMCYFVFFAYNIYVNNIYGVLDQFYIDLTGLIGG